MGLLLTSAGRDGGIIGGSLSVSYLDKKSVEVCVGSATCVVMVAKL